MKKSTDLNVTIMNVSANQRHLWVVALFLGLAFQMNAQCLIDWSFKNVNDIPSTCNASWSEEGISMQLIPTTPATSCNSGSGCVFSITENAPNQYNFLQILSGALEVNIPDPANFHQLSFTINEFAGACQTVRYYDGNNLVLEEDVVGNYYTTNPSVTATITFDKISIAVSNAILYNFRLFYTCNDGAPAGSPNIGFEEFQQGPFGGTGTSGPFITSEGVDIYVSDETGAMLPPNQAQYFIQDTRTYTFGHGNNLFWPMHPVKFDFTTLPNPVSDVFFDLAGSDLDVTIKVNDGTTYIGPMSNAPADIAPNVVLTSVGGLGNTSGQRYSLSGAITSLTIGGLEFFMDNVTFIQGQNLVCEINDPFLNNVSCNADESVNLDFYMTVQDPASNTFSYSVDGLFAGTATLSANNQYTLENVVATNGEEHLLTICMDGTTSCCNEFNFFVPNCSNNNCIDFESPASYGMQMGNSPGDTVALSGNNNGVIATVENYFNADSLPRFQQLQINSSASINPESINLNLDFSAVNGTVNSLAFTSAAGCCHYVGINGTYFYAAELTNIAANLPANFSFTIYNSYCVLEGPQINQFSWGNVNQFGGNFCYSLATPVCSMAEATIEYLDCDPNDSFNVELDFTHNVNTDSFNVTGNGLNYGNYAYADLPITVGSFYGDGVSAYELIATDLLDPDCNITIEFDAIDCISPPPCEITSVEIIDQRCQQQVEATLEILVDNPTNALWEWWLNGTYRGTYNFSSSSNNYIVLLTDGAVPGAINTIRVCVNDNPDCCFEVDFLMISSINGITINPLDCNANGNYNLMVDVGYAGTQDSFDLSYNGNIDLGTFAFVDTPVEVGPFPGDGSQLFLTANVTNEPGCLDFADFGGITCPPQNCIFDNPTFTILENCDSLGNVSVEIDFFNENASDSFYVFINGWVAGLYPYTALPLTLNGLDGTGQTDYDIRVNDQLNATCELNFDIGILDCSFICGFNEFFVQNQTCNNNGTVNFDLLLIFPNNGDFELFLNGNSLGNYNHNPNFTYSIQDVNVIPNELNLLTACNLSGPECCQTVIFTGLECPISDCAITNIGFNTQECIAGVPFGWLNLDFESPSSDQWDWWINGDFQGTETLNPNNAYFISLEAADPTALNELTVCMNDNPDCCETIAFQVITCFDPCIITNFIANPSDCDADNFFEVEIFFSHLGAGDQFTLTGNGENYGVYNYDELPLTLTLGPADANTNWELVATDVDDPDCSDFVELGIINCPNNCELSNPTFELTDCDPFARFSAEIDFDHSNTSSGFVVYQNGIFVGNYSYADLPITRQGFEGDGVTDNTVLIIDQSNPDCTLSIDIGVVDCNVDCAILEFGVFNQTCNTDGTYNLTFSHIPVNTTSTSFEISLNGDPQGTFDVNSDYIYVLENVTLTPGQDILLTSCMVDFPNCCADSWPATAMDCINTTCEISNLDLTEIACDGSVPYAVISFSVDNPGNDFWEYWINGEYQEIGNIGPNGETEAVITLTDGQIGIDNLLQVCINDQPNCCQSIFFDMPDCTPCEIGELNVTINDCINEDLFTVSVDFDFSNTSDSFTLQGNGNNYGTFSYENLPIDLSYFGDGVTIYELVAIDQNNNDCQNFAEFGPVDCNPINGCEITNLSMNEFSCDGPETFGHFSFDVENPGNNQWEWWINGIYQGIESFGATNNYSIGLHDADPQIVNTLTVCVNDQPDCCQTIDFEIDINCPDNCELGDLQLTINDCNDDNLYTVTVDFDYAETSDSFVLRGNGIIYGTYSYTDLPVTVGPFVGNGSGIYELVAIDQNNNDCRSDIDFGPVDCTPPVCMISDLSLNEIHCVGDNTYGTLFFEVENPGNDFWEYWINGEFMGTYALEANNFYTILLTQSAADPLNTIEVCINDQPNCCSSLDFEVEDCEGLSDCIGFPIFAAGGSYGTSTGEEPGFVLPTSSQTVPVTLEEYQISAGSVFLFGNLAIPDVSPYDGILFDIGMNTSFVNFSNGVGQVSIEIYGGCCFYMGINGVNEYYNGLADIPTTLPNGYAVTITPINTGAGMGNRMTISGAGIENFFFAGTDVPFRNLCFETEGNNDDCLMENLSVTQLDCGPDGTYSLLIDFEHDYPGNEEFVVFVGSTNSGNYNYSQLPLTLLHIPVPDQNFATISVGPSDQPNCELNTGVDIPDCPSSYCMDFNDLAEDLSYTPNNVAELPIDLFTQEDVKVTLENCGDDDLFWAEVRNPEYCQTVPFGDNALFLQNGAVQYDFSALNTLPGNLTFEYCGEGSITINGEAPINFSNDLTGSTIPGNGFTVEIFEITSTPAHGYVQISGTIEQLEICGTETSLGPPCYETTPMQNDDCYGFENLLDGGFYSIEAIDQSLLLYNSAPLKVSLINEFIPEGSVGITTQNPPSPFNGAAGNYANLFGAMEFDFSGLTDPTEFVSFDFAGTGFSLSVNNEPEVNFPGMEPMDTLLIVAPGVILYLHRESSNPNEGQVSLFGEVERLVIASENILLDNICYYLEIQAPDVWPGDINSDNVADHCDLLYLGIANSTSGPARGNPTGEWEGQGAPDWDQSFIFEDTNYKHADANGDGTVDAADYDILVENLGKIHGPEPTWQGTEGTPNDPPLYIDLNATGPLVAGEPFTVPIILGSDDIPVTEIYGLAFSIVFDEDDINLSNTTLSLDNSWLGTDLWKIESVNNVDGRVDVSLTRTDGGNVSGKGAIAEFTGIIDDLVGKEVQVEINNVKGIMHDETPVFIHPVKTSGSVTTDTEKDNLEDGLQIFPIPTTDVLFIRNFSNQEIKVIRIFNLLGQQMLLDAAPRRMNQYQLAELASGTYFVELQFIGEKITRKIQVFNK